MFDEWINSPLLTFHDQIDWWWSLLSQNNGGVEWDKGVAQACTIAYVCADIWLQKLQEEEENLSTNHSKSRLSHQEILDRVHQWNQQTELFLAIYNMCCLVEQKQQQLGEIRERCKRHVCKSPCSVFVVAMTIQQGTQW